MPLLIQLLATLAVHALACRCLPKVPSRQAVAALCSLVGYVFVAWHLNLEWNLIALAASHAYFHWFNMSETARRIKILMALCLGETAYQRKGDEVVDKRIERLHQSGVVTETENGLTLQRPFWGKLARGLVWYEQLLFPERVSRRVVLNSFNPNEAG